MLGIKAGHHHLLELQSPISQIPLNSGGCWDMLSWAVIYSDNLVIGTSWNVCIGDKTFPEETKQIIPLSKLLWKFISEKWDTLFWENIHRMHKAGGKGWIRLKRPFNIWHLAGAAALTSWITATNDAPRRPLEREHGIPWIMIDGVMQVVFREHLPLFICWLLGNNVPMAIF